MAIVAALMLLIRWRRPGETTIALFGALAAALLCGDSRKRPVADALAAGKTVRATIPLPGNDRRLITVRSIPVSAHHPAESFVLLLEDAGDVGSDVVCFYGMLTRDLQMKQVFRLIERVADDDVTVLIRGESGTGKELVAAALHAVSKRRGLFQAINCAALPAGLLEAELFGTVRGSFTGYGTTFPPLATGPSPVPTRNGTARRP